MPVISVIIPVYNCEKYLPATLDAVLNQTFSDFEIIAVNNSSPDGCLRILQDYAPHPCFDPSERRGGNGKKRGVGNRAG